MTAPRSNLASLVDDFARHGSQIAIVAPRGLRRRHVSYGELANLCHRFAAELVRRDIVKGDRVLICGDNGPEWIGAFFGCVLRGVLPVPIDVAGTADFIRRVEREVTPKLIVGESQNLAFLRLNAPLLFFHSFEELITTETAAAIPDLAGTDALQIVFTSGTTGDPKGIVHTHNNVLASLRPIEMEMQKYLKYERVFHPIRFLHTLPLSHVFGQFMGLWIPPLLAAEVHYESRLVAAEIVERIQNERISVLAAVPRVLDLLQQHLSAQIPDLASRLVASTGSAWKRWWRFRDVHRKFGFKFWAFICGGASLPSPSEEFWNSLGFLVVQGYGMTETTALVSLNHPFKAARGSIGQVLPGREVRLSAEGEVLVRGETISNATWQGGRLQQQDSEWLATGDLAEFDKQGNLHFRGRKKDVIVTSAGLNIYPEDLESALRQQAAIKDCVIVETVTEHGPEPLAVVLPAAPSDLSTAVAAANRSLAEFQQIRRWIVWPDPDLPRTSTGKVLRREVARRMLAGDLGSGAIAGLETGELNLDSLGRVELQARLEQQFGITLDDRALQEVKTQEDVRNLVANRAATPLQAGSAAEHTYPHWPWNPLCQAIRSVFLEAVAMPLLRFLAKPKAQTHVSKYPSSPLFIVANHVTSYDVPFVLHALPGHVRRRAAVAMSGEMILDWRRARKQGHWFLNLVAPIEYILVTGLFNVFPLPQFSGFRRSFQHAGEAIDHGYSVIVFPEGRRSDDGTPQPFMKGAGLLWKELGTPALAVRIEGLGEIKAGHSRWFRTGTITTTVRQLLPPERAKSPEELTRMLEDAVFGD